jgi:hypothetical protein
MSGYTGILLRTRVHMAALTPVPKWPILPSPLIFSPLPTTR